MIPGTQRDREQREDRPLRHSTGPWQADIEADRATAGDLGLAWLDAALAEPLPLDVRPVSEPPPSLGARLARVVLALPRAIDQGLARFCEVHRLPDPPPVTLGGVRRGWAWDFWRRLEGRA